MKIKMLRLFEDCIDMSEPNSEGWTIIGDLVSSFNQESAPVNSNSIFWFLRSLKTESMVGFGPKTIWHGLQHAIRSFIDMEQKNMVVKSRLDLLVDGAFPVPYAMAIAYWIVLLAVGKKLLPLLLAAGSILHIEGYDYEHDTEVDPIILAKQLPYLYETWCKHFTSSLEKIDEVLNSEFDVTLEDVGWSGGIFRELESTAGKRGEMQKTNCQRQCSICHNDYDLLGFGLVEPRWITFTECATLEHRFSCCCQDFLESQRRTRYSQLSPDRGFENVKDDSESGDETFYDAEGDPTDTGQESEKDESAWTIECGNLIEEAGAVKVKDPFQAVAIQLYRTQARIWLGTYVPGELFCGTCFLRNEGYIDEEVKYDEGFLSSMPASFSH